MVGDVELDIRQEKQYMHDGAPANYTLDVPNHLNETFPNRSVGTKFVPKP